MISRPRLRELGRLASPYGVQSAYYGVGGIRRRRSPLFRRQGLDLRRFVANHRNRIESGIGLLKERFDLYRHGAGGIRGLQTRTAAKLAAYTL